MRSHISSIIILLPPACCSTHKTVRTTLVNKHVIHFRHILWLTSSFMVSSMNTRSQLSNWVRPQVRLMTGPMVFFECHSPILLNFPQVLPKLAPIVSYPAYFTNTTYESWLVIILPRPCWGPFCWNVVKLYRINMFIRRPLESHIGNIYLLIYAEWHENWRKIYSSRI